MFFCIFCFLFRDHGVDSCLGRHGNCQSYPAQVLCCDWMKMDDIMMTACETRDPHWMPHPPVFICNWRKCIKYMESGYSCLVMFHYIFTFETCVLDYVTKKKPKSVQSFKILFKYKWNKFFLETTVRCTKIRKWYLHHGSEILRGWSHLQTGRWGSMVCFHYRLSELKVVLFSCEIFYL